MHGSLASSCAVADVRGGTGNTATVKAWSATQSVYDVRNYLSTMLSIPARNIEVIQVEGTGCYGGNGADPGSDRSIRKTGDGGFPPTRVEDPAPPSVAA